MIIFGMVALGVGLAVGLALLSAPAATFSAVYFKKPRNVTEHCHNLRVPPPSRL